MNFHNCISNFHKSLADLQTNLSTLAHTLTHNPNPLPPPPPPFQNALSALHRALSGAATAASAMPPWARISQNAVPPRPPMSWEAIEERLEGVPVYALSNASDEFLLVSGSSNRRNLGLFCFSKDDAQALLHQVASVDPHMRDASKVVTVALNKVFQLKVDGVAFRLIPEQSQVKNALNEREKSGFSCTSFSGVPVFQSKSLLLRSQNRSYRPLFFRKEDLENSLQRASRDQNHVNPALKRGDILVATLEDVIKEMKENPASDWDDVVFIPPGFDVSTDPKKHRAA